MVNEFVEKYRGMLRFYGLVTRVLGWIVLVFAPFFIFSLNAHDARFFHRGIFIISIDVLQNVLLRFFFPVLFMWLISQLIRYVIDPECRYGWLLRYGDKILYAYAFVVILNRIWKHSWFPGSLFIRSELEPWLKSLIGVFLSIVPSLAFALVLVGIGYIMRRLVAIVTESRTLV